MHKLQLLYFKSESCGVCHSIEPKIKELCEDYPAWECQYILASEHPDLCGKYLVFSSPAVLLLAEGKEIWRKAGIFSIGELENALERYSLLA